MTAVDTGLQDLKRQHPEWEPWLAVVQELLRETANPEWGAVVPARPDVRQNKVPVLAGATLVLAAGPVRRLAEQLIQTACHSGSAKMASLEPALAADLDVLQLFKASLCHESARLKEIAEGRGADSEAFQAVAALIPMPFLQACNHRWAGSIAENWMEGYCPLCGAWPAFAEVRGIERSRYFRCGRCGGEWHVHCLVCPYCGMTDHNELVSLVPEKSGSSCVIDACKRCLGYVKTFTVLQASPPAKVIIDDLASVNFDLAAVEEGFKRPQGPGYSLDLTVTEKPVLSERRFFWRA